MLMTFSAAVQHSLNQALILGTRLEVEADALTVAAGLEHPNAGVGRVLGSVDFLDAAKASRGRSATGTNVAVLEIFSEHHRHRVVEHNILEFHDD